MTATKKSKKKNDVPPPLPTSPPPELDGTTTFEEVQNTECPFASEQHEGKELADVVIPLPPKEVYRLIFENEEFQKNVYHKKNFEDMTFNKWEKNAESGEISRTLTMTAKIPSKVLGASTSRVTEIQTLSSVNKENTLYVVNCLVANSGIPYAEHFRIHNHYCITREKPEDGGNTPHARVKMYFNIKYRKSTIFIVKAMIEKNSYDGMQGTAEELVSSLFSEAERVTGSDFGERRKDALQRSMIKRLKTEATNEEPVSTTVKVMLLLLLVIAGMNAYLFFQLKNIETIATRRPPLIGEKISSLEELTKPPTLKSLEDTLNELKVKEMILKKHFQNWKERLNNIFESINAAEAEIAEIIALLPEYESELLKTLTTDVSASNAKKSSYNRTNVLN